MDRRGTRLPVTTNGAEKPLKESQARKVLRKEKFEKDLNCGQKPRRDQRGIKETPVGINSAASVIAKVSVKVELVGLEYEVALILTKGIELAAVEAAEPVH